MNASAFLLLLIALIVATIGTLYLIRFFVNSVSPRGGAHALNVALVAIVSLKLFDLSDAALTLAVVAIAVTVAVIFNRQKGGGKNDL